MVETVEQVRDAADGLARRARATQRAYAGDEERPLGTYLSLLGVYATTGAALGALLLRRESRRRLRSMSAGDFALLSVATFKLSRVIARDSVMSPVRAPFVRFRGSAASPAEVEEEVRAEGWRKAVGELLTCPFCLAQWIATAFVGGWLLSPDAVRAAATTLTVASASDVLQLGYSAATTAAG